jgi:PleD family two-component response regulator
MAPLREDRRVRCGRGSWTGKAPAQSALIDALSQTGQPRAYRRAYRDRVSQEDGPPAAPLHVLIIHRQEGADRYAEYLRSEGFRATEANTSEDGVAKALALEPDFIVLDFDLDGETTARLKSHLSTSRIPVIALAKLEEARTQSSLSE